MKANRFAILLSCLCIQAYGGTEGHGGDPLRQLFDDARTYAADRVQQAKPCAFNVDVRPDIVSWIMNHKIELATDIRTSPHYWVTDPQSTCAFTQTQPNFPITFSFEACRPSIHDVNDAIFILAHESSHHFGVTDETFADEVGRAIARLGQNSACNPQPSADPFDPASCPGRQISENELKAKIPIPNSTEKLLGRFTVSIRQRTCYGPNFCTNWQNNVDALRGANGKDPLGWNYWDIPQKLTGTVTAKLTNNRPEIIVYSDGTAGSWNYWGINSQVNTFQKLENKSVWSAPDFLTLDYIDIREPNVVKGWMTNSCLRQTAGVLNRKKDQKGNDIDVETEMVVLSNF